MTIHDLDRLVGDRVHGNVVSIMCTLETFWVTLGDPSGGHLSVISFSIKYVDLLLITIHC